MGTQFEHQERASGGRRRAALRTAGVLGLLSLFLAACAGDGPPIAFCPAPVRVVDAGRLTSFQGAGRDLTDVRYEVELTEIVVNCDVDENEVEAQVQISFNVLSGPANQAGNAGFGYFMAVAKPGQVPLVREAFDVQVPFSGKASRLVASEELDIRFQLQPEEAAESYRIYVGLTLSPEELRYNRANRSAIGRP